MYLTTNGVVITDAIKFVKTNKEKLVLDCYFYWNLNRCFTFQKKIYPLPEIEDRIDRRIINNPMHQDT